MEFSYLFPLTGYFTVSHFLLQGIHFLSHKLEMPFVEEGLSPFWAARRAFWAAQPFRQMYVQTDLFFDYQNHVKAYPICS